MVTLEQLQAARGNAQLHYTGPSQARPLGMRCATATGPRGGRTEYVVRVRQSGAVQVWKTRPGHFRMPVKFGLYESAAITHENARYFHLAADCPAGIH